MKTAIYIGRFQPFHNGHMRAIEHALRTVDLVVVILGSAQSPRTVKNPFTVTERMAMIRSAFGNSPAASKITFASVSDNYNETQWISSVLAIAAENRAEFILGVEKDASSYYLRSFPTLELIAAPLGYLGQEPILSATEVRTILFDPKFPIDFLSGVVSAGCLNFLRSWKSTHVAEALCAEWKFIQSYKSQWSLAPYPPTFVTVDAVVVQSGHVLMVRRGASPGKGLLALPGGFLNQNERLEAAAVRELIEETCITIPADILRARISATGVFDSPDRSLRGRTITHAFLIRLQDDKNLPVVKGSDDAADAMWVPISSLDPTKIYEDHLQIINVMTAK